MKWATKTRGRELPGMEALLFTVLVAHGGVVVAATGCGGRHCFSFFSPLLHRAICSLYFLFPLTTMFLPLCNGFMEVLLVLAMSLVAAKRKTGGGMQGTLLWFLCLFFFLLLPSVCASVLRSLCSFPGFSLCFSPLSLCFPVRHLF
jgi:hypothetical protein